MAPDVPGPRWPRHHGARLVPGGRPPAEVSGPALNPGPLQPDQDRPGLVAEVRRVLEVLPIGATVVVACSGGPDSTALALLTAAARPDLRLVLAYVAHGLRGSDLDHAEAVLVTALAARLAADHVVLPVTVVRTGGGPEEDARAVRHVALAAEAVRRGAAAVLYGHHAEDQAATLLLRIARGTGPHGLAGIAAVSDDDPPRLRPLLRLRRADLARVCGEEHLPVATDPTNADRALRRVRVEDELLPALTRIGPDPVGALGRLAALVRADERLLADLAEAAAAALPVRRAGPAVAIPSAGLRALPTPLSRRIVRSELARLASAGRRDAASGAAAAADAATVARVLAAADGARATLPGPLRLEVGLGWHVLIPEVRPTPPTIPLPVPGDAPWPVAGLALGAAASGQDRDGVDGSGSGTRSGPDVVPVRDADLLPGLDPARLGVRVTHPGPFTVRTRLAGDRIRTPGGTRRLGDVLADAGVPRSLRDLVPVVAAGTGPGLPVWVPGVVVAEDHRAEDGAATVLRAEALRPHRPGPDGVGG